MRRTEKYAAMTKDAAHRRGWTFYEGVNLTTPAELRGANLLEYSTIFETSTA
jgi:hypothetical protein